MLGKILKVFVGSENDRAIKRIVKAEVRAINALTQQYSELSDEELRQKHVELKNRHEAGESLNALLADAFATVREAADRVLGLRPYDVQLIGGVVLHRGQVAEMRTGEGKTLVATMPVYLNSLSGSVHVVTVNDYLAKRDCETMRPLYEFLGLKAGYITGETTDEERSEVYKGDVVYVTNNELGFDYLRDNMKYEEIEMTQQGHHYAIVDEVDSILIDEARTPLIISGPSEDNIEMYKEIDKIVPLIDIDNDVDIDEKQKTVTLTEQGMEHVENILRDEGLLKGGGSDQVGSMYSIENISLVHHVNKALVAHLLYEAGKEYMITETGEVAIIDEFTGRMMEGRRYSNGLHQAIEAKEQLEVKAENQTLATITFQNYFRMYDKLAGMTGTAETEAVEFEEIYKLRVLVVPTNKPIARQDHNDLVFLTWEDKINAVVDSIIEAHERKQPLLVGTVSLEKSEELSKLLRKRNVKHNLLNAKYHEREAEIVMNAGVPGAVTIATNMAGRGTDIQLGGNYEAMFEHATRGKKLSQEQLDEISANIKAQIAADREVVIAAGGLYVIGTERHESRRIDNQLRGRSGRQGDIGASRFFLSLEDDLMRIFGSEKLDAILKKLGIEPGESIEHPWISRAIEKAQSRVEGHNFDIRKQLLKFDDIINIQRKTIFGQRNAVIKSSDITTIVAGMAEDVVDYIILNNVPSGSFFEQWDIDALNSDINKYFAIHIDIPALMENESDVNVLRNEIRNRALSHLNERYELLDQEMKNIIQKGVILQSMDTAWKEHLYSLDNLRQGIGLRAYGQKDPLNEFKQEAYQLFEHLLLDIRLNTVEQLWLLQIEFADESSAASLYDNHMGNLQMGNDEHFLDQFDEDRQQENRPFDQNDPTTWGKIRRNDKCPCGSGKKFKHCHGKIN